MHQYLDDNPTGMTEDVYQIDVTVTDDDGGVAVATSNREIYVMNPDGSTAPTRLT
jgi:hypothetical protein